MNDETPPKGGWGRRIWGALPALTVVFLVILFIAMAMGARNKAERLRLEKLAAIKTERPAVNVVVQRVVPMSVKDRLSLPAVIEPWVRIEVPAEVQGRVVQVSVAEGARVKKGDIIATLDSRDYENESASLKADYDLANKTLARYESLLKDNLVAKVAVDDLAAKRDSLGAALKNADLKVERCRITAPIGGIVDRMPVKAGMFMKSMDVAAVLLDIDRVKAVVGIPESDVDAVRGLGSFTITIEALGGRSITAKKHFLAKSPETMARLYRLELEVPNPGGSILPGMFGRAEIVKREETQGIGVPLFAVISRDNRKFVFLEEGSKAVARDIQTGYLDGWRVLVNEGLNPNDRVIVVGHRSVEDGQEVKVIRTVTDPKEISQ